MFHHRHVSNVIFNDVLRQAHCLLVADCSIGSVLISSMASGGSKIAVTVTVRTRGVDARVASDLAAISQVDANSDPAWRLANLKLIQK